MNTLLIIFGSILLGYLLRKKEIPNLPGWALSIIVWSLLFFFGIVLGTNKELVSNLDIYGLKALIIAIAGIAGSIAATLLLISLYRKKHNAGD